MATPTRGPNTNDSVVEGCDKLQRAIEQSDAVRWGGPATGERVLSWRGIFTGGNCAGGVVAGREGGGETRARLPGIARVDRRRQGALAAKTNEAEIAFITSSRIFLSKCQEGQRGRKLKSDAGRRRAGWKERGRYGLVIGKRQRPIRAPTFVGGGLLLHRHQRACHMITRLRILSSSSSSSSSSTR
jgi:hypothetical protein